MTLLQTTSPPLPTLTRPTGAAPADLPIAIDVAGLNFFYGPKRALEDITIQIPTHLVTAFIGPSGCGKSTFLRTLNRMNDIIAGTRVEGKVIIEGRDIYAAGTDVVALRRRVGRSEEHTSELQSQSNLVCRLLLEKKKHLIISMV